MTNVILVCKHTLLFKANPPLVGEIVWCLKCRKDVAVTDSTPEWSIKCRTCRYSEQFGQARLNAEIAAGTHRRRKGKERHVVALLNGVAVVRVYDGRMPTLDDVLKDTGDSTIPPF